MGASAQLLVPGLTVDKVVVLCILVNAYTTYPCLVLVIQARARAGISPASDWRSLHHSIAIFMLKMQMAVSSFSPYIPMQGLHMYTRKCCPRGLSFASC